MTKLKARAFWTLDHTKIVHRSKFKSNQRMCKAVINLRDTSSSNCKCLRLNTKPNEPDPLVILMSKVTKVPKHPCAEHDGCCFCLRISYSNGKNGRKNESHFQSPWQHISQVWSCSDIFILAHFNSRPSQSEAD